MANRNDLPHVLVGPTSTSELFTAPPTGGGDGPALPMRSRGQHGRALQEQLDEVAARHQDELRERAQHGFEDQTGITVTFESEPGFELALDSLEPQRTGIELLAVTERGGSRLATVFVPDGKLSHFARRIEQYVDEETAAGKPRHQKLIAAISAIRRAAIDELWTDDAALFPAIDDDVWWEVWLRAGRKRAHIKEAFHGYAQQLGLRIGEHSLDFLDRSVVLAFGDVARMTKSIELLDCVAELRLAKQLPGEFMALDRLDQREWSDDLMERVRLPARNAPAVCLLDTGVNNKHRLLELSLEDRCVLTVNPAWGADDHHGHGTGIAGVALYGDDLAGLLASSEPVDLVHELESVKILPRTGTNDPALYGHITGEAVARAEIESPGRERAVCLTVTDRDCRDRGRPSSWSAALDSLLSGAQDDERRLLFVSAGNIPLEQRHNHPDINHTSGIHDPAQAWNAVTVGAYTERVHIDRKVYPGWQVVAPPGGLSPSSSTSLVWERGWPGKPDIVMEGGNAAIDPVTGTADLVDELMLLTTNWRPSRRFFDLTDATSAATALAARLGAMVQARYPGLWPETIRALLVHSARWTPRMLEEFPLRRKNSRNNLMRCYGYGVPDSGRALHSASNALTLVIEDSLQPFRLDRSTVKTDEMHLHEIPWPRDVLLGLGETRVRMRVTLSYFIEPNPGRRGARSRHVYQSHGLRFAVKHAEESVPAFRKRVNGAARANRKDYVSSKDRGWLLGSVRDQGSIHSDIWEGVASDLAQRGYLAVYPVNGWWRTRKALERWNRTGRYALIVSIETPEEAMDVYTPVANMVRVQVAT